MILSRRNLLRAGGAAALAAPLAAAGLGAASAAEPAPGSTLVGVAPDASDPAIAAKYGQWITALHPYDGKVFYGYGNYDTNSGSQSGLGTNISCYNPASGTFETPLARYNTEAVLVYREINGRLYTPAIDPFAGSASFASNHAGSWERGAGIPGAEHVYDVAGGLDGELLLCGSAGGGTWSTATVWRSTDGGSSWEVFFQESPEADGYRDGYERFYWMARIGNMLYLKADNGTKSASRAPMRTFDLAARRWGTVSAKKIDTGWRATVGEASFAAGLGDLPRHGGDVMAAGGLIFFRENGSLYTFDGKKMQHQFWVNHLGVSDTGDVLSSGSSGTFLHRGGGYHLLAADVNGPVALVGNTLYHARESSLYARTVTVPDTTGTTTGGGGKPVKADNPNKGPKKK